MKQFICIYCEKLHTEDCPNHGKCWDTDDKPYFKAKSIYKSKIICGDKVYFNIHHFNKFKKILGKIIFKIKIEDI